MTLSTERGALHKSRQVGTFAPPYKRGRCGDGSAIKEPRSTGDERGSVSGRRGQEDKEEEPAPRRSFTISAFRRLTSHELVKLKPLGPPPADTHNALKAAPNSRQRAGSARVGVGERRLGPEKAHSRHGERQAQQGDRSRYGEHGDGVLYTRHGTKLH